MKILSLSPSILPLSLFWHKVSSALPNNPIQIGGYMDLEDYRFCYQSLLDADTNNNEQLSREEYVEFARLMAPTGMLDDVTSFNELPLAFTAAFLSTACLCSVPVYGGNADDARCCVGSLAHWRIPAGPDDDPSTADRAYLYAACSYTRAASNTVLSSRAPTLAPASTPRPIMPPVTVTTPTRPPSPAPMTRRPTLAPSPTPVTTTPAPVTVTAPPTLRPTVQTTLRPSHQPSSTPLATPTAAPLTTTPTLRPSTLSPTGTPSITASPTTLSPTATPSTPLPTTSPSPARITEIFVNYNIAVENGRNLSDADEVGWLSDLQVAMNYLVFALDDRRQLRRLTIGIALPTSFRSVEDIPCPPSVENPNDLCQAIVASVRLYTSDTAEAADFQQRLQAAIDAGDLQTELERVNPETPVTILSPSSTDRGEPPLSTGAKAGISVAVVLVVLLVPLAVYLTRRRPSHESEKDLPKKEQELAEDNVDPIFDVNDSDARPHDTAKVAPLSVLGASAADYGRPSRRDVEAETETDKASPSSRASDGQDNASSAAGSSGWSSSAGLSSYNDRSTDDAAYAAGATLAAIGAASAVAKQRELRDAESISSGEGQTLDITETRSQLESHIQAGDWAAVGATAALLAAASDSQSGASRSHGNKSAGSSSKDESAEAARAAHLDQLVDAGDWEGLIAAAARYEAAGSQGRKSGGSSASSAASNVSGSASTTGTGTLGSPSSVSDTQSKAQRRQELREEVEALVRRVVPEEIDNIDEMMEQFKGREEELVETLRTMQERSIAQKARTAVQKAAKVEARRSVQRGVVPGTEGVMTPAQGEMGAVAAVGVAASGSSSKEIDVLSGSSKEAAAANVFKSKRTALELAIEAGDWQAVGEAAAMMSDGGTISSGDQDYSLVSGTSGTRLRSLAGEDARRAGELDALIQKGDWKGVLEATKRYKVVDDEHLGTAKGPSKEEEEALKEAEVWMKIAEQTKAGGATDSGASDAADWAIQRSLSQMKEAEARTSPGAEDNEEV